MNAEIWDPLCFNMDVVTLYLYIASGKVMSKKGTRPAPMHYGNNNQKLTVIGVIRVNGEIVTPWVVCSGLTKNSEDRYWKAAMFCHL